MAHHRPRHVLPGDRRPTQMGPGIQHSRSEAKCASEKANIFARELKRQDSMWCQGYSNLSWPDYIVLLAESAEAWNYAESPTTTARATGATWAIQRTTITQLYCSSCAQCTCWTLCHGWAEHKPLHQRKASQSLVCANADPSVHN